MEATLIDWTECPEVERVPGKLGGKPAVRDSRVRPEDLVGNRDEGEEWLVENYDLPIEQVRAVLSFYDRRKTRPLAPAL